MSTIAIRMSTQEEKLPKGWVKLESISRKGKFYYYNKSTQKSCWRLPAKAEFEAGIKLNKQRKCELKTILTTEKTKMEEPLSRTSTDESSNRNIKPKKKRNKKKKKETSDTLKITNSSSSKETTVVKHTSATDRIILAARRLHKERNKNQLKESLSTKHHAPKIKFKIANNKKNMSSATSYTDDGKYADSVETSMSSLVLPRKTPVGINKPISSPASLQSSESQDNGKKVPSKASSKNRLHPSTPAAERRSETFNYVKKEDFKKSFNHDNSNLINHCHNMPHQQTSESFAFENKSTSVRKPDSTVNIGDQDIESMDFEISEVRTELSTMPMENTYGCLTQTVAQRKDTVSNEPKPCRNQLTPFLILDTNVVLKFKSLLNQLLEVILPNSIQPHLVIPWTVLQELDALKDRKGVDKLTVSNQAQKAVKYLHALFEIDHPRVHGQTPQEAAEASRNAKFQADINDDKILQCCLYSSEKYTNSLVYLITQDINLRNKALVMSIKASSSENIIQILKSHISELQDSVSQAVINSSPHCNKDSNKLSPPEPSSTMCHSEPPRLTEDMHLDFNQPSSPDTFQDFSEDMVHSVIDLVLSVSKTSVKTLLEYLLKEKMIDVYKDLWEEIVYRKPPWSFSDILESIKKHWIAVFGDVLGRNKESTVTDLLKAIGYNKDLLNANAALSLIESMKSLVLGLENHEKYSTTARHTIENLDLIRKALLEYSIGKINLVTLKEVTTECNPHPEKIPVDHGITNRVELVDTMLVSVWSAIHNTGKLLFSTLESTKTKLNSQERRAAVSFFCRFVPLLTSLQVNFQELVSVVNPELLNFGNICSSVNKVALFLNVHNYQQLSPQDMSSFFYKEDHRSSLKSGFEQLKLFISGYEDIYINLLTAEERCNLTS